MLMHAGKTVEYWAYGGDFGSFPDDAQFCINGMIWPNREPHPGCFEAKAAMVTCTHTLHCPPYHLVLSTFSSARVGLCGHQPYGHALHSRAAFSSFAKCFALIAACSHNDVLLLAWRYFASAQSEGSTLAITTHMWQSVHCVLTAAVFSTAIACTPSIQQYVTVDAAKKRHCAQQDACLDTNTSTMWMLLLI